ncbi:MAG TPA: hypothetical protein VJ508_05710, partial [Saprospiraceae bacterium]|nr:hypothetical protein [Saprospiraceae bacterium]
IFLATKKLSGKKKKDVYVTALEKGFEKLTRRDMARIETLRNSSLPEDWEDILNIANEIQHRQDKIEPFLPLVSESGYQAKFTFVHTDKIVSEARPQAVSLYQKRLDDLVTGARDGNKRSARQAYDLIDHIHGLSPDFNQPALKDEMWDKGVNKILVRIDNNSGAILPPYYEEELLSVDFRNAGNDWDRFYTEINEGTPIDFEVALHIQDIAISPEQLGDKQHLFTKSVKDGWEYVLDARGNVAKDSLGNDIKRDKFTNVSATVVETFQTKSALIHARMDIINKHDGVKVYSQPLEIENQFNHTARKVFGDTRALDDNQKMTEPLINFPQDATMIMDALKAMKPKFFNEVKRFDYDTNL